MNYYEELGKINKKIERLQRCKANCGSNSAVVIEVTKAEFLALVSGSTLTFPATYKITDVDNGLYLETFSSDTFSSEGTISLFVPDYTVAGDNLGQLNANDIQSVGVDEYVIWADYYWRNNTASPITPTIDDLTTLSGGLTKIDKLSGSIYLTKIFPCSVDDDLIVAKIFNPNTSSEYLYITGISSDLYTFLPINNNDIFTSDLSGIANHFGNLNNIRSNSQDLSVTNNSGNFNAIIIDANGNEFSGNNIEGEGNATSIKLTSFCRFNNNIASGASYGIAHYLTIELHDNSEVIGNEIIGNGALWDIHSGEECKVNGNILNAGTSLGESTTAVIQDLDQMYQDECNNNEFTGSNTKITALHQFGYSKVNGNTFSGDGTGLINIRQSKGEITNCVFSQDNKKFEELELRDAKITNATNISITNCELMGIDLDLTGFTTDISDETIQSGKGWFTITRDFDTTPLVDGIPELHNIIPIGAYITSIKAKGSITSGTSLTIGLETDDPSLISQVVANYAAGQTYNGISAVATANRSLRLVSVGDLNAGSVTILVEFMI